MSSGGKAKAAAAGPPKTAATIPTLPSKNLKHTRLDGVKSKLQASEGPSTEIELSAIDADGAQNTKHVVKTSMQLTTPGFRRIGLCGGIMSNSKRRGHSWGTTASTIRLRPGDPEVYARFNDMNTNADAMRLIVDILTYSLITAACLSAIEDQRCTVKIGDVARATDRHAIALVGTYVFPKKSRQKTLSDDAKQKFEVAKGLQAASATNA